MKGFLKDPVKITEIVISALHGHVADRQTARTEKLRCQLQPALMQDLRKRLAICFLQNTVDRIDMIMKGLRRICRRYIPAVPENIVPDLSGLRIQ